MRAWVSVFACVGVCVRVWGVCGWMGVCEWVGVCMRGCGWGGVDGVCGWVWVCGWAGVGMGVGRYILRKTYPCVRPSVCRAFRENLTLALLRSPKPVIHRA